MPTAAVVTTLVLTALVIDRIVASIVFLTTYRRVSRQKDEMSRATAAEYRRKVLFFLLSGGLSAVALKFVQVRILPETSQMEPFITWFVLVAASDRIAGLMGTQTAPAPAQSAGHGDLHVTGTLALDEESAARLRSATAGPK
jgi:hypothetical protein